MAKYTKVRTHATVELRVAVGYARVSTDRQAREGVSLDVQEEAMARLCEMHGWQFGAIYKDEGISGRSRKRRPGLEAAVKTVCESGGVLLCYNLSRLARSAGDAEQICEQLQIAGADLVSVTEPIDTTSAMGRAFFGIVSVFARLQSDLAGEQVAAANAHTVAELGYRTQGTQQTGYKIVNRQRVAIPAEQQLLEHIIDMRRRGYTCREIASTLNDEQVPTTSARRGYKRSGAWSSGTVHHMLARVAPDLTRMHTRSPFVWTNERRQMLGTLSDRALARRWDCSIVTVTRERLRLGIPPKNPKNSPKRKRGDCEHD